MKTQKIAVVTGANRGIGLEICRQLAQKRITVVLTARDESKGKEAAGKLKKQGLDVVFHQLDVTDEKSIRQLAQFVAKEFGRLDILVNNAGIMIDYEAKGLTADVEKIKQTMDTNVYGALKVCQELIPIMQKNDSGRVINLSSGLGQLNDMGGGAPGYRLSKVGINAVTRILASELNGTGIQVNSMCPGWVRTDMGGANASRPVEQGADTAVWLATAPKVPTGKLFRDRKEIPW